MLFHFSTSASSSALRFSKLATWSNFLWRESRAARVLRARFNATLSEGSTMMGGSAPLRLRVLLMDALVAGDPLTDDFLRWLDVSNTRGELALDALDLPVELVLTVRSRAGATGTADTARFTRLVLSSSGNRENQLSDAIKESPLNMGEVSKESLTKGESLMSGEVILVNVVEGGADCSGSAKMSLGETVRADPAVEGLMAVKAVAGASQGDMSPLRPAYKLAPESNELELFRSAMVETLCCGVLLELENKGTGGRCD